MPDQETDHEQLRQTVLEQKKDRDLAVKAAAAPIRRKLKQYAPTLTVILPDKTRVEMPLDEQSAAAKARVLSARMLDLFEKQLVKMENATLTPKELADLVVAGARMDGMIREQYMVKEALIPSGGGLPASGVGKAANGLLRATAEAAAAGTADAFISKLNEMKNAAQAIQPVIEIEPAK